MPLLTTSESSDTDTDTNSSATESDSTDSELSDSETVSSATETDSTDSTDSPLKPQKFKDITRSRVQRKPKHPIYGSRIGTKANTNSVDSWTYVMPKDKGSTPGVILRDGDESEWMVKFQNVDMSQNELLANRIYDALDIPVPTLRLVTYKGRPALASKMLPDVDTWIQPEEYQQAWKGYAADAWLRNWDVAISGNMGMSNGTLYRLDTGGALKFRARGGLKPGTFADVSVSELESLRGPLNNGGRRAFGPMTKKDIYESIRFVTSIPQATLKSIVHTYADPEEREIMYTWLSERLDTLRDMVGTHSP